MDALIKIHLVSIKLCLDQNCKLMISHEEKCYQKSSKSLLKKQNI